MHYAAPRFRILEHLEQEVLVAKSRVMLEAFLVDPVGLKTDLLHLVRHQRIPARWHSLLNAIAAVNRAC